jgi:hypothetical protein
MAGVYRGALTANGKASQPITVDVSDIGMVSRVESFVCDVSDVATHTPGIGTASPTDSRVKLRSARAVSQQANLVTVSLFYVGWLQTLPDPVWACDVSTGEEPIRINPNFDALASAAIADDGYVVDEDGVFRAFTAPAEIAGIESYLAPKVTLTKRYVTTSFPSAAINAVGKRDVPDFASIASITPSGYNWLKIACPFEDLLGAWAVTEVWLRSGPNGWNTIVYEES